MEKPPCLLQKAKNAAASVECWSPECCWPACKLHKRGIATNYAGLLKPCPCAPHQPPHTPASVTHLYKTNNITTRMPSPTHQNTHSHPRPAHRLCQVAELAEPVAVLQAQHLQCIRHHHALHPVVWRGHALKALEALKGSSATGGLVGNHAAGQRGGDTSSSRGTARSA